MDMLRGIGKQSGESVESVLVLSNSKFKKKSFPTGADWYVEFANIFVIFGIPVSVRFARTPVCE